MTVGVATSRTSSADGFTLIEVLVAMALIGLLASGTAVLTLSATRSLGYSQLDTAAVELARGRLDQLMSLPWGYGSAQAPSARTDGVTDLSSAVPGVTGSGLFSPGGSLDQNTVGFVDHADHDGRWVGNALVPSGGARFTRRWHARPVAGSPDLLVVRVRVIDLRGEVAPVTVSSLRARTAS